MSAVMCSLLLLSLIQIISLAIASNFECEKIVNSTCSCTEGNTAKDFEFRCPIINTKIITKIEMNSYIFLDCQNTPNYIQYLPKLPQQLGIDALFFQNCKLPSHERIREISSIFGTRNILKLRIMYSEIKDINRLYFKGYENLQVLYLQQNDLEQLPRDLIYDLHNLTNIDLRGNGVKLPPDFFQHTKKLKTIELGANNIRKIPDGLFSNLYELSSLNLWSNQLTTLSENVFGDLKNLNSLDIRNNGLVTLPSRIFENLTELSELALPVNRLKSFPEGLLSKNKKLRSIQLDNNMELSDLPMNFFANLTKLAVISMENCNISSLHKTIFWGNINLKDLVLRKNSLDTLDVDLFRDTTALETLHLDNNKLTSLPDLIFQNLAKLKMLNLYNNKLTISDHTLTGLDGLERLNLHSNMLTLVTPRMMKQIPKVRVINLSNNYITFDDQLSPFVDSGELEEIYLKNNSIDKIPYDLKFILRNLTTLDLSYNNFTYIAYTELHFTQRRVDIDLSYNNIQTIDMSMAEAEVQVNNVDARSYNNDFVRVNIEGNMLHCDCQLYYLVKYFDGTMDPKVHAVLELDSDNVTCIAEDTVLDVKKLNSKTFTCDLPNDEHVHVCPDHSNCLFRQADNMYIVNSSYRGLTEPPVIGEHALANMEVYLQGNSLKSMPLPGMGYEKTRKLFISHNEITDIQWLPPNITILELHNNRLSRLDNNALNLLNTTTLTNMTLHNNPWACDCDTTNFTKYLQNNFRKVRKLRNVTCAGTTNPLVDTTEDELCPFPTKLVVVMSVMITIISLIICILVTLYFKYRRQVIAWLYSHDICPCCFNEEEVDEDKIYDAFISYSHKDEEFVLNEIVHRLENGPNPFRLCLHFRNWEAGEYITTNIAKSVEKSCRTLVILSPNFLESEWGKMEFRTAHVKALKDNINRVVVVLYGDIGKFDKLDEDLKAYLQKKTYIKWDQPCFWENLQYAMPHRSKYQTERISIGDKQDLMSPSTPVATTPPADIILMDPMKNDPFSALNVSLINGSLVNNGNNNFVKERNLRNIV